MNKFKFLLAFILGCVSLLFIFRSCNYDEFSSTSEKQIIKQTLQEKTLLGNDMYLPKGTKWFFTNQEHNEVAFELPMGYKFLLYDQGKNEFRLSTEGGGYSCTCSGGGSCTTFYNKDVGYGCLQSTCGGSCTGKVVRLNQKGVTIEGVVYENNDMIDVSTKVNASLSEFGKKGIFETVEFKNKIKKGYDMLYKYRTKPNFNSDLGSLDATQFEFAKVYLYGVELGIIIPKDDNVSKLLPNLRVIPLEEAAGPKGCKCSNGGSSCKLEKQGMFGYVAYYCTGCTTCTMY